MPRIQSPDHGIQDSNNSSGVETAERLFLSLEGDQRVQASLPAVLFLRAGFWQREAGADRRILGLYPSLYRFADNFGRTIDSTMNPML